MKNRLKAALISAAVAGGLAFAMPAAAQQDNCGLSGSSTTSLGNYDPFNPAPIANAAVTLNLTRFSNSNKKTQWVNYYFTQPAGSPAYQIMYQGQNVLYTEPGYAGAPPLSVQGTQVPGMIQTDFGGASQPDTKPQSFVVTIPPGVDLSAGDPIRFDIRYVCKGTGGWGDVSSPQIIADAITLQVNVLSALQASYVGAALDFGEIGDKATPEVLAAPIIRNGAIRVASSGPYTVAMTSDNNFRLMAPGASTIDYEARFLGQARSNANPTFMTTTCARAGISGQHLPISVTLKEGGQTKIPAPEYSDYLRVTVTPLATAATAWNCATL